MSQIKHNNPSGANKYGEFKGGRPKKRHSGGRPTKMTKNTLQKLEEAFAMGCSDVEACLYADIGRQTLYNYQNENPDFLDRKLELKENPVLKARSTVFNNLDDKDLALKFLERRNKKEFSPRQEHTGADGDDLKVNIINYGEQPRE